jgi:hypothetical protein
MISEVSQLLVVVVEISCDAMLIVPSSQRPSESSNDKSIVVKSSGRVLLLEFGKSLEIAVCEERTTVSLLFVEFPVAVFAKRWKRCRRLLETGVEFGLKVDEEEGTC